MSKFFKNIMGKQPEEPSYVFGRFSDVYRAEARQSYWDEAVEAHEQKKYLTSIFLFLQFLSDESQGNILIDQSLPEKMRFQIFQGSKCIHGFANQDGFFASTVIARCSDMSLGAMRMLLEENYELRYASYALDSDDNLTMVMHSDFQDASPYKLFYGLKELATQADKKDDVLVAEFSELMPVHNGLIIKLGEKEKQIKIQYFRNELIRAIDVYEGESSSFDRFPGLLSCMLLSTAFSIDYLLKPEGKTMDHIENIYASYFQGNALTPQQKNADIIRELKQMKDIADEALGSELYETKNTFGRLEAAPHLRLREVVDQELIHFNWYYGSELGDYAIYLPRYVCSLLMFSYALPVIDHKLIHLMIRLMENEFFVQLGYDTLLRPDGSVDEKKVWRQVTQLLDSGTIEDLGLKAGMSSIPNDDAAVFSAGLLMFLSNLEYTG